LDEREQAEVREICVLLGSHPLKVLQAASVVREGMATISDVRAQIQQVTDDEIPRLSLEESTDTQKRLIAIMAAAGGIAVPVEHLRSISQSDVVVKDLQELVSLGLVQADGSRFQLAGELSGTISRLWDLASWEDRLIEFLVEWLIKKPAQNLLDESLDLLVDAIHKAEKKNRWLDVVKIGRGLERVLIFRKRWQTWLDILNLILKAARALGDRKVEGWVLHQIGTRAACLGFNESARGFLTQALNIRQAIGDQAGLAVTQNNLHVFFNIPLPPKAGQPGCRRCLTCGAVGSGVAVIAAVVIAGAFLLFGPRANPVPQPNTIPEVIESNTPIPPTRTRTPTKTHTSIPDTYTPTQTKTNTPTSTPTSTRTPTPTRTPTRTPSPTNTLNSPPPAPEIVYPTDSDTVLCPSGSNQVIMDWLASPDSSGIDYYEVSLAVESQPGSWLLLINHERLSSTQLNVTNEITGRCGGTFQFYVRARDLGGALGESSFVEFFVYFPGPD
jgi:hypothetical protein